MPNNKCQKPKCEKPKCEKPCDAKVEQPCKPKCTRYDSWCESDSSCDKPKKYKRTVTITEYKWVQKRNQCKRGGHKVKCCGDWESASCSDKYKNRK
ncbi:MAG TPA: hypothetical protein VLG50_07740 [Candidatus Saccharimonadales bacterium]|nr:hypothetical protein [Candidatus Saccharimonadales bacterium]